MVDRKPGAEELAAQARAVLAGRLHGVLSTLSVEMPGFPFGSVVPYCLGGDGAPLFLLSDLAHHTRNLRKDSHAAFTVYETDSRDVAQADRLTAVGQVVPVSAGDNAVERYFRYFPRSRGWFEELDFRFFRLVSTRWHFNGGFATARWFGNERILRAALLTSDEEAGEVERVTREQPAVLVHRLKADGIPMDVDDDIRLCGLDAEGMDIAVNSIIHRVAHPSAVTSVAGLRALLASMAAH